MEPDDVREWISFDEDGETWLFDVTFLTSNWSCIYGAGCPGIEDTPAPEAQIGCCTHGAHFTDKEDRVRVRRFAELLTKEQWQLRKEAKRAGGPILRNDHGEWVTRVHDDACIFLNRPGFPAGVGCALHLAAVQAAERPMDWKPEVCWQLPLRLHTDTDDKSHTTRTLREWKRRDWGEGGFDFHWWCTESDDAFIGADAVYVTLREEIIGLIGEEIYERLVDLLERRDGRNGHRNLKAGRRRSETPVGWPSSTPRS